jgi:hypothetical protein
MDAVDVTAVRRVHDGGPPVFVGGVYVWPRGADRDDLLGIAIVGRDHDGSHAV